MLSAPSQPSPAAPAAAPSSDLAPAVRPRVGGRALVPALALAAVALLGVDAWLVQARRAAESETVATTARLDGYAGRKAAAADSARVENAALTVELLRKRRLTDRKSHFSVALDSGRMTYERDGNRLRVLPMEIGPSIWVRDAKGDSTRVAAPRGVRTVARVVGPDEWWTVPRWVWTARGLPVPPSRAVRGALGSRALVLKGGTVIYSLPAVGPLADPSWVLPGSVRVRAEDLEALAANLRPGMSVYLY